MKSKVFIKPVQDDLDAAVRDCFDTFGGADEFVKENVFIKINGTTADINSITKPEVVVAAINVLKDAKNPPKKIYVFDNAAVGGFTRLVFKAGNMAKKVKKAGAKPLYLDELKPTYIDFNGKILRKNIPVPKFLYESLVLNKDKNAYINIPILKSHVMCGVTICIKNQHGLLYGDEKIYGHDQINDKILDIMEIFKPDFNIVDATSVVDYGPLCIDDSYVREMGILLSGIDPVAVDTIGSKIIEIEEAPHISMAAERGFGTNNLQEIEVLPSEDLIGQYKIPLNWKGSPLETPAEMLVIEGKENKGCITGCGCLKFFLAALAKDNQPKPVIGICGKGFNKSDLNNYSGPFIVNGPCAVSELKEYFKERQRKEKIDVSYIDAHLDLATMMTTARKAMGLSIMEAYGTVIPVGLGGLIRYQLSSKLHGGNFSAAK